LRTIIDRCSRQPFSCSIETGPRKRHLPADGGSRLPRLLTLLLVWTAALALPLVAAPAVRAMTATPCPMEASGMMAADHAGMDCCDDDDKGAPDQKAPCKPGMACFATAAALPAASVVFAAIAFDRNDPAPTPTRDLQSRPPDRTLRPPIAL
jgi:hypothetical protein